MPVNADSLGSYLRRERESRHMSLHDISAATKIQFRFLEALEQDDYDHLPPTPFVVGFLRSYAQCVSLAPDEIIAAYHASHGSSEGLESLRLPVVQQPRGSKRLAFVGIGSLVGLAVLGVVLHVLTRAHETSTEKPVSRLVVEEVPKERGPAPGLVLSTPDTPAVPPAGPTPPAPQVPVAAVAKVEPGSPSAASTQQKETPRGEATKQLVLEVNAVEDTWLNVEIDGDKRHALLLRSGKHVQWEAVERFVLLTIGNARGTRVSLNGQEISLPPIRGNVIRDFSVTRALLQ